MSASLGLGGDLELPWHGLDQNSWAILGSHGSPAGRVGRCEQRCGTGAKALEKAMESGVRIRCLAMSPLRKLSLVGESLGVSSWPRGILEGRSNHHKVGRPGRALKVRGCTCCRLWCRVNCDLCSKCQRPGFSPYGAQRLGYLFPLVSQVQPLGRPRR